MKGTFTTIFFILMFYAKSVGEVSYLADVSVSVRTDSVPQILNFEQIKPYFSTTSDSVFIINFWATWCAPCVAELPYFEQLNTDLQGKKAKILLISLDFKSQINSKLIPFLQKNTLKSEVLVLSEKNPNAWIPQINEEWSGTIPATLIFNKNKRQFYEQNFEKYEDLKRIIADFIQ